MKTDKIDHINHPEEFFTGCVGEFEKTTNLFRSLFLSLSDIVSTDKFTMTRKYDGNPTIVCGRNPSNGRFFVGTKSVFNNIPKLNYTLDDIKNNHSKNTQELKEILGSLLDVLPKMDINGILQGELLYSRKELEIDSDSIKFKPNTIVYSIPRKSDKYSTIKESEFGIAFHTQYIGKDLTSLKSQPIIRVLDHVKPQSSVFLVDTHINEYPTIDRQELEKFSTCLFLLEKNKRDMNILQHQIQEDEQSKNIKLLLKMYFNWLIRSHKEPSMSELDTFVRFWYNKKIDTLKRLESKNRKIQEMTSILSFFEKNVERLEVLCCVYNLIGEMKDIVLKNMPNEFDINTYLQNDDKTLKPTNHEGLVVRGEFGVIKLVNRKEFSRENFKR